MVAQEKTDGKEGKECDFLFCVKSKPLPLRRARWRTRGTRDRRRRSLSRTVPEPDRNHSPEPQFPRESVSETLVSDVLPKRRSRGSRAGCREYRVGSMVVTRSGRCRTWVPVASGSSQHKVSDPRFPGRPRRWTGAALPGGGERGGSAGQRRVRATRALCA